MKVNPYARDLRKNQTDAEKLLWDKLRNRQLNGLKFRRQQSLQGYVIDFICFERRLIIELDGGLHKKESYINKDNQRTNILKQDGYIVLRFWNGEVERNLNDVIERIRRVLQQIYPSPSLSHKGRGNNRKLM